jgi:hypothetical protein
MATTLGPMPRKKLPPHLRRPVGRPPVYPWDRWLDGETHTLESGTHFQCSLSSFRTQLYQQARARGHKVTIKRIHDDHILIRADRGRANGNPQKYDWDTLFDGEIHQLRANIDFTSKPSSFRAYAREVAGDRGVRVSIKSLGDSLFVQAILPEPDPLDDLPFQIERPS